MKNLLVIFAFVLTGCALQPRAETIYPTPIPTPTLAVITKPMDDVDRAAALEFFYHLKVHIVSSEYEHIAEEVRYPITVLVEGEPKTYVYVSEFSADFKKIFSEDEIRAIAATDESELVFTPEGVRVGNGLLWFDYFCTDPDCLQPVFLISRID